MFTMIGRTQPAVRFEEGWLSADTAQGVLKVRLWPSPEARLAPGGMPEQSAEIQATRLLMSLQLPVPETWGLDRHGLERVLDPQQFYAETFSASCRSNDAIRRALLAMPYDIEAQFYNAPPKQRWNMLKRLVADYDGEEAMVSEADRSYPAAGEQGGDMS